MSDIIDPIMNVGELLLRGTFFIYTFLFLITQTTVEREELKLKSKFG